MAAHSGTSAIVAAVPPDQPVQGWPTWLREIAGAINVLGQWANRPVLPGVAFAALPVPPQPGSLAYVTDSTVAAWGAVVVGGGVNRVLAWHNGTAWTVIGV